MGSEILIMDELETDPAVGHVNFVPCLAWVGRGRAKANPDKVQLTQEELAKIINQTKKAITGDEAEADEEDEDKDAKEEVVETETVKKEEKGNDGVTDIEKEYGLDTYDDEDDSAQALFGIGDLVSHADQRQDDYLEGFDEDDDASEAEDFTIRPTDNLILVGHVEGNASILEVYGMLSVP